MQVHYSKAELNIIAAILEVDLVDKETYLSWIYQLIEALDEPEEWMINIGFSNESEEAVQALNKHLYGAPFEVLADRSNLMIAGYFLKHKLKQMTWLDFLLNSGFLSDDQFSIVDCEYFFLRYNSYKQNPTYIRKWQQKKEMIKFYSSEINQIQKYYAMLHE